MLPQLSQITLGWFCTTDIQPTLFLMPCTYCSCKHPSELCNNFEAWKTIQSIYTQTWPFRKIACLLEYQGDDPHRFPQHSDIFGRLIFFHDTNKGVIFLQS